ncbi:uncharacterized protein LOC124646846 [Lolium rigidum]|uniref:uncharacterized protein LOC124646846 n=1 Tax=Lolium rigidum TaxID=89674 RepID=UPI001F5CA762|nr:uncharacterized protein LOC124646846 [Lolium rigidum]
MWKGLGSVAVRGAGPGDGGGVLAGLRGLAGGCVLQCVPADDVVAVRDVGVPEDAVTLFLAVAVHVPQGRAGQPQGAGPRVLHAVPVFS